VHILVHFRVDEHFGLVHFVLVVNEADCYAARSCDFPAVVEPLHDAVLQAEKRRTLRPLRQSALFDVGRPHAPILAERHVDEERRRLGRRRWWGWRRRERWRREWRWRRGWWRRGDGSATTAASSPGGFVTPTKRGASGKFISDTLRRSPGQRRCRFDGRQQHGRDTLGTA